MAKKKLVEHNALLQAIEMGSPKAELLEKFGIKTTAALKTAYFNALVALDKIKGSSGFCVLAKQHDGNALSLNSSSD